MFGGLKFHFYPKARKVCESVCKLNTVLRSTNGVAEQGVTLEPQKMRYHTISRADHKTSTSQESEIRIDNLIKWYT